MADEMNKDVVGARIKLDISKIPNAFKGIDEGAKKNKASFESLNQEISKTEKTYSQLAKAMDKASLNSDERRKKILDESNALVAQRRAAAELLTAKKQQLDATNQIVDSKLQAQLAIQKRRQDAIEQQEKEHQKRMDALQSRADASAARAGRATGNGTDAATRERVLREEQDIRRRLDQAAEEARQRQARERERALQEEQRIRREIDRQEQQRNERRSNLSSSLQYLATGTLYYNVIQGAREAIRVIKDFEDTVVNLKRVMASGADIKFIEKSMIQDAKDYGFALKDVGDVYVQIAQQGFNEKDTAALAKTALMAKNVESSFRDAEQAQQLLTGAVLNYNLQATDSERLLDRINQVSNDYATDSNKLLQGINRTGAAAKNAGVPINELIGYLTVLNEAGQTGAVAGNAVKSFISFSSRDIAIDKLEKYVGTIKQGTGEMMPFSVMMSKIAAQWKTLSDAERHEITQAVARGDQASRFIAVMDNYEKVMKVAATAENSLGSAHRENEQSMTTLSKQTLQLKASWEGLMISIGDSGLLTILKAIVHESKLLVDGFDSLPGPIRNTLVATLTLGTAITVLNAGFRLLTGQSLISLVTGLVTATRSLYATAGAAGVVNAVFNLLKAHPVIAALSILSTLIGAVTIAWSHHNGTANETVSTLDNNQREVMTLTDRYKELKSIVDDNTKSDKEIKTAKTELAGVIEKVSGLMPNLVSQWDAHGKAIDLNIGKIDEWKRKYAESVRLVEKDNIDKLTRQKADLEGKIAARQTKIDSPLLDWMSGKKVVDFIKGRDDNYYDVENANKILEYGKDLSKVEEQLKNSQDTLDILDGKKSVKGPPEQQRTKLKSDEELADEYKLRKEAFTERMNEFRHLVNVEASGYSDAAQQLEKLRAIRSEFSDMKDEDLYGIDEDIYRTEQGRKIKAKGMGGSEEFKFPLNDIDTTKINAEQSINDAMALIDEFIAKEFSLADSFDKTSEKVQLFASHQTRLHGANELLRNSTSLLQEKQSILNELYESGSINADDYNKATEDVQSRLRSFTGDINKNSIAWWNDAKAMKEAKEQQLRDSFDFSEKWIAHEKATREMSAREEYEAWLRVQARYLQGTELRKRADEQVYAAKMSLIADEEKKLNEMMTKEKAYLEKSKKTELDKIETAKKAYVDAQDEKIRAIDRLMSAEQNAYEDKDYAEKLKEKQDRTQVLQSAVGPDAIKERKDLVKEIEKMQEEHQRVLTKRGHEAEKQRLEDDKRLKEEEFEKQKKEVENHYESLLSAFDNFKNDQEGRAELLKNIMIAKDQEKNAEILKNLDIFITQYRSKSDQLRNLAMPQDQVDLNQYNENKDLYDKAKSRGDTTEMARLQAANALLRQKYNLAEDKGKLTSFNNGGVSFDETYKMMGLQRFKDGGVVQGRSGQATPVIAHAGEMYINPAQQSNLFKLLNFSIPKIHFATPSFEAPKSVVNHYYSFDNSIGNVAVNGTNGVAGLYDQRGGLIERQRSLGGEKVR